MGGCPRGHYAVSARRFFVEIRVGSSAEQEGDAMLDRAQVRCSACRALMPTILVWAMGGSCPLCLKLIDDRPAGEAPGP